MRFSEKEAMQKGDGLYTACSGVPSMGRMMGSLVLKSFVNAGSENKRYLNQPCQVAAIREKMISGLSLNSEFPQLIIRLGYSAKMPYSFRRRVPELGA